MDWKDCVLAAWAVFVAIPGVIAFFWKWQDRRDKKRGPLLAVSILEEKGGNVINGWKCIRASFRNDGREILTVHEISLIDAKDLRLSIADYSSLRSNKAEGSDKLTFTLTVRPEHKTHGSSVFSNEILLFLGSTAFNISTVQVLMRIKYSTASDPRRMITIKTTSEPIKVSKINDNNET